VTAFVLPNTPLRLHTSPFAGLGRVVRQPGWALFAASLFVLWIGSTGSINFVGVLIKELGGSERLIGLNWTIAALLELPVMLSSAYLLSRFGASRLLTVAFVGYFFRILFYGLIPGPEWVLAVNLIHAFSYVPFLIGSVAYANQLAPPELKATSQGLLFAVMNLGSVFGALFSGWLYDHQGISGLFRTLAFLPLAGFTLYTAGQFFFNKRRSARQRRDEAPVEV
jgi:PPP family 3-phenylpropionic acid transporter